MLVLAGLVLSVQPQDRAKDARTNPNSKPDPTPAPASPPDYEPMWAVNGTIRWRKDYGVVPVSSNLESSLNNILVSP